MKHGVICYYSGTGNTKLACRYIKKRLTNAAVDLFDITNSQLPDIDACDFVGFATFTDWGDPPYFMKQFIDKLPRQEGKPAFLLNTCAGMSGKTLKTLKLWVNEKGFKVIAGHTLRAPENYPPLLAKGRTKEEYPTPNDLKQFNGFITELDCLIANLNKDLKEAVLKIGIINSIIPRFARNKSKLAMGDKFVDRALCNGCGVCRDVCPYKAVDLADGPVFDEDRCYGCWSCFNHCPQKAIHTAKIKNRGHYSGPLEIYRQKLECDKN